MSQPLSSDRDTFKFLDLPAELRLMVYEHIPNEVVRHEFREVRTTKKPGLSLQIVQVGIAILSTCRQIHMEVIEIIKRRQALAALIPISIAIKRWDERSITILYSFYQKIYNARWNSTGSNAIYPKLRLPGSNLLLSAFNRLIRALPDVEFALDFPHMDLYAREMLLEISRYGCFNFQSTIRVPPGSILRKDFDVFQASPGMIIKWEERKY